MIRLPQNDLSSSPPLKVAMFPVSDLTFITPKEWRWTLTIAIMLALLVFAPLVWVTLRGTEGWQFMGVLHNYRDGATYLSKIELGYTGSWLVTFQHTPENHNGAFIQVLYLALGHLGRLISVSPLVMFHVARLGAALFMYVALYQLAAVIWSRVRTRRAFFVIVSIGSGFGWLLAPLLQTEQFPDFALLPEAYPFFSSLVNVHFPLTIALMALLGALLISTLRPGVEKGAVAIALPGVVVASLLLSILYPQALIPIGAAMAAYTAMMLIERSQATRQTAWLLMALALPAVPFAAYYAATVRFNPMMAAWNAQNVTPPPSLPSLLLGFGLPLLLALPGIVRAVRRLERDGDRLMLLWLLAIIVSVYLPTSTGRRYAVGMTIPIAYFAARSLEVVWLQLVARRWRNFVFGIATLLMAISPAIMLFLPITSALVGFPQAAVGIFLEDGYGPAFAWLRPRTDSSEVVLAAPVVSTWVPGYVGARVVSGHPYETLNPNEKDAMVRAWFAGQGSCNEVIAQYQVKYIVYGPQERALGAAPCLEGMRIAVRFDDVTIYAPSLPPS